MGQQDRFRIDSHKLIYHPQRVADWLAGKEVFPIYVEVGPAGICNCRCTFCSVDYIGYKKRFLATAMLTERLAEMARLGVKSVMFAGEGEPFLHRDLPELIVHADRCGIDVALTTNGILMRPGIPEKILGHTRWIKVSCNGGTPESYAAVHRTKGEDFERVIANLRHAVRVREEHGYDCTLGIQLILLPENEAGVVRLAELARDIGLDYLVVKPYTRHYRNEHDFEIHYDRYNSLADQLAALATPSFNVIFRTRTMAVWDSGDRGYEKCLALPFWAHIDAGGTVWGCGAHLEDERFRYGNINDHSFQEIWQGETRRRLLAACEREFDISACRLNCRMAKVNQYLWELRNPVEHVNFI